MNDLDLVRELRADVPSPSPARVAAGRDRLLTSAVAPAPRVRRPRRVFIPIGAIALGAAAAVAVTVVSGGTHPSSPASVAGTSSPAVTSPRMSLAAQVLTVAANRVGSESAARPSAGQWVYTKLAETYTGAATESTESWRNFDGTKSASLQDGKPVIRNAPTKAYNTSLDAYNALAALPSSVAAIRATADHILGTKSAGWLNWAQGNLVAVAAPKNQGEAEFDYLAEMLWVAYAAAPAEAEAHVFEAMAAIPGVTADTHATTIAGQPAIGVSANGGESVLFLDPQTYRVIGLKAKTTPFMKSTKSGPPMTYGTLSMAYEKVALVNQPGDR